MTNPNTSVRLYRVVRAPAERVGRSFLEPSAMERRLPSADSAIQR